MPRDFYTSDAWGSTAPRTKLEQRERQAITLLRSHRRQTTGDLIDIGSGDGCFLEAIATEQPGWRLHGFDGSEAQTAKARCRLPQAMLRVGDVETRLPYDDSSFDIVFAGEIIEHLINPDHLIAEATRLLRPNGLLCITTPNLLAWYNRVFIVAGMSPLFVEYSTIDASVGYGILRRLKEQRPVGHLRIFHPRAIQDLLRANDLQVLRLRAAEFTALPKTIRVFDRLIAKLIPSAGSVNIFLAQRQP